MKLITHKKPSLEEICQIAHLYVDRIQPIIEELREYLASHNHNLVIETDKHGQITILSYPVPLRSTASTVLKGPLKPRQSQRSTGKRGRHSPSIDLATTPPDSAKS